ncbi:MAG TPA: hypothetical protein VMS73_03625 [Anaerolineaceae bacterium]|nr:hypothetical protein [Anaerolineaceae bacterium]
MSYQEKRAIVSIGTGALILGLYCFYAFGRFQSGAIAAGDLKSWAVTILIFIGIGIAAAIAIQIVFHILLSIAIAAKKKIQDESIEDKEIDKAIGAEFVEDEMDKLIELKSMRAGLIIAGIGFIAALVSLALDYPPAVMLNILFISFSGSSLFEGAAQLYYYRRGIRNG